MSDFANWFLGFGSLKGKFWIIGPEPGGGYTPEDVCHRALVWSARGRREADDLHGYHSDLKRALEASKLQSDFDWIRRIQPTWGPLIRVILAIDEHCEEIDREDVRIFQASQFGRFNGQNGVFELLPFSSPTQADWRLGSLGISWLRTRSDCEARWVPMRCNLLRMKVANYEPRLVLFYGNNSEQLERWCRISPCSFTRSKEVEQLLIAGTEGTLFAIIPHPVNLNRRLHDKGRGAVKKFLANVGAALRKELI